VKKDLSELLLTYKITKSRLFSGGQADKTKGQSQSQADLKIGKSRLEYKRQNLETKKEDRKIFKA